MTVELDFAWVEGGTCLFGDAARPVGVRGLWWSATCITHAQADAEGVGDEPVTSVSLAEADAMAAEMGGRLPTSVEWEWMAAGLERRRYPWGDQDWEPLLANLTGSPVGRPLPVGSLPDGATPDGLLDVAGNVWEWTASTVMGGGAVLRGGSYNSHPLYARCRFLNAAPAWLRSPGIGVRVVREP